MNIQEIIAKVRLMEIDHDPDGWTAIPLREVSALVDAIEELQEELEFFLDQSIIIEHKQDHERMREIRKKYGRSI